MIKLFKLIFLILILSVLGIASAFFYIAKDLPNPKNVLKEEFSESTKIYDRTGEILLYEISGQEKRTWIDMETLPAYIKQATITAEDQNFYHHFGIDFGAIIRSTIKNISTLSFSQGGSTITQQFIKNSLLTPEKSIKRKIKEVVLAVELEFKYSKDEILEFYLNKIAYGSNIYGIEAASQVFFGKKAKDLTLAETTIIAALTQKPSYFSPYGKNLEELKNRQMLIINSMVSLGYIDQSQANEALKQELNFISFSNIIKAPHFSLEIKKYLDNTYGQKLTESNGLSVITTLDYKLQKQAEKIVAEQVIINAEKYDSNNAALVAIDPNNGEILSMVGSSDYFNNNIDGNVNVALRLRQPGSSFKPFVYAYLFEEGFTPETLVFDLETEFTTRDGKPYIPQNYTKSFNGPITLKNALAQSINVAAVKVLYLAGINNIIDIASRVGIKTIDPDRVDLALTLGGAEVRLLDITSAYGIFANNGVYFKPKYILEIKDKNGNILEKYFPESNYVIKPNTANIITDILSDNIARSPIFGFASNLNVPGFDSAVKTGTTSNYRDGWTIGYTPNIIIGVWAGNNNNSETLDGEGAYIAAPIWNKFITFVLNNFNDKYGGNFTKPDKIEPFINKSMINGQLALENKIKIDSITKKLATNLTPPGLIEEKIYKEFHSLLYYINPLDNNIEKWEKPIQEWARKQTDNEKIDLTLYDDIHTIENKPKINIISPEFNQSVSKNINININVETRFKFKQADLFINNQFIQTFNTNIISAVLDTTLLDLGQNTMGIRVFDEYLNSNMKEVSFIKRNI